MRKKPRIRFGDVNSDEGLSQKNIASNEAALRSGWDGGNEDMYFLYRDLDGIVPNKFLLIFLVNV